MIFQPGCHGTCTVRTGLQSVRHSLLDILKFSTLRAHQWVFDTEISHLYLILI